MQQQALVNPYTYPTQDSLSPSMQQKALVTPNPYSTKNTFSSLLEQQALTKPNTPYSVQKTLVSIQASDFSARAPFPFKYHPKV